MIQFIRILILSIFTLQFSVGFSQTKDSIQHYDVVYLTGGGTIKGEILSFQESDGFLIIKDTEGRKFSLSKNEYQYYIENKPFVIENKKDFFLKPRKENQFEFGIGFSIPFFSHNGGNITDDQEITVNTSGFLYFPLAIQLNVGQYINRKHYIGLSMDYGLLMSTGLNNYFTGNLVYRHQYDGYKRNVAFYVPIKLGFTAVNKDISFYSEQTVVNDDPSTSWIEEDYFTTNFDINNKSSYLNIEVGQGFSFVKSNKKSIDLELTIYRANLISSKYATSDFILPIKQMDQNLMGIKLAFRYNF